MEQKKHLLDLNDILCVYSIQNEISIGWPSVSLAWFYFVV